MNNTKNNVRIYKCSSCGRELKGEAFEGIEEEIRILLEGRVFPHQLDKAWFVTRKNKSQGKAFCMNCIIDGKARDRVKGRCDRCMG